MHPVYQYRLASARSKHASSLGQVLGVAEPEIGEPTLFLAAALRAFEARHQYYEAQR